MAQRGPKRDRELAKASIQAKSADWSSPFARKLRYVLVSESDGQEADAIHAYVIEGAWKAYDEQQNKLGDKKGN
jgi:hypothetical protein